MVVSKIYSAGLEDGTGEVIVASGPVILTSVVVAETGEVGVMATIQNGAGSVVHMLLSAPALGSAVWMGAAALPDGLKVESTAGTARITVTYI